jgi:crotonobetainyl-CoA:carnitine CoA-transferase CaiB-like acyl-CoA transferase
MPGALDGVRVLEFSEMVAGPFGGMILADLGADVIKIEPPSGDPWRFLGAIAPNESAAYIAVNRGKRGLAIDLKTDEGRAIAHALARDMDVVIVNYRPDAPAALGIDYDTLSAINPKLIYLRTTAFGPSGPQSHRPGYDIVAQAMTGLMASDGKSNDAGLPMPMNPPMVDFTTGLTVACAVCAALLAREKSGVGQKIEASLMATALAVQGSAFLTTEKGTAVLSPFAERIREARTRGATWSQIQDIQNEARSALPPNAYYRPYETTDGVIIVACLNAGLYRKFAGALGLRDERLEPGAPAPTTDEYRTLAYEFVALCEVSMREKTTEEWLDVFDKAGVPAGPMRMVDQLRDDPQVLANGLCVEVDHALVGKVQMFGPLFSMSATPSLAMRTDGLRRCATRA